MKLIAFIVGPLIPSPKFRVKKFAAISKLEEDFRITCTEIIKNKSDIIILV